ncbi:MAG: RNA polymerase sigma-70 factor [Bacteroidales bacterium]|jgi:RNA polymerase sigma-70 factor (ECF subfamily)|nr:RNA polymerase sigma-70 factor [Bacteroidales bacterium]
MGNSSAEKSEQQWETYFQSLYTQYYSALCVFAASILQDNDEAEEMVQTVFLKLWEQKESIESITSIKAYLYRAVKNTCLNQLKRQKIASIYVNSAYDELKEIEANHIDPYLTTELQERIHNAIQALPERCREVFELSRFENKKNKEISEMLDISLKAVEANITRALQSLKKQFGDFLHLKK